MHALFPAGLLEERGRSWQRRYPRLSNDLPNRERNLAEEPIQNVELWDLVGAFGRILREKTPTFRHVMKGDETPTSEHIKRVYSRLKIERSLFFTDLFSDADRKATLVGIFLAILELAKHGYILVSQNEAFEDIRISYCENARPLDFVTLTEFDHIAQAG